MNIFQKGTPEVPTSAKEFPSLRFHKIGTYFHIVVRIKYWVNNLKDCKQVSLLKRNFKQATWCFF